MKDGAKVVLTDDLSDHDFLVAIWNRTVYTPATPWIYVCAVPMTHGTGSCRGAEGGTRKFPFASTLVWEVPFAGGRSTLRFLFFEQILILCHGLVLFILFVLFHRQVLLVGAGGSPAKSTLKKNRRLT